MSLTAEVLPLFEHRLAEVRLVPSSGGVFEVSLDGETIFSKKALGRHAEKDEIVGLVREKLGA